MVGAGCPAADRPDPGAVAAVPGPAVAVVPSAGPEGASAPRRDHQGDGHLEVFGVHLIPAAEGGMGLGHPHRVELGAVPFNATADGFGDEVFICSPLICTSGSHWRASSWVARASVSSLHFSAKLRLHWPWLITALVISTRCSVLTSRLAESAMAKRSSR